MATYTYQVLDLEGVIRWEGIEYDSPHLTPEACCRALADRPRPWTADWIHVWKGDTPTGKPSFSLRHRQRALAAVAP